MNRTAWITALCLGTVLVGWGLSWEMLQYQTGGDDLPKATVAVFYRFLIAGLLFVAFVVARDVHRGKLSFNWPLKTWGWVALLGLGFFSTNYSLYYFGSIDMPPGLVSLFFASIILTNLILTTLVLNHRPKPITVVAALIGIAGLVMLLWPSLFAEGEFKANWTTLGRAGLCMLGTITVSFATLVQMQLNRLSVPVTTSTAFAMLFGAIYVGFFSLGVGYSFDVLGKPASFYWSFTFLVLLGSIAAFSAYLKLVGLIGPNRGSYVNLATAVVALMVSFCAGSSGPWMSIQFIGVLIILIGYYMVLRHGGRDVSR